MLNKMKKFLGYVLYIFVCSWMPHYSFGHVWIIPKYLRQFSCKLLFDKCGNNVDIGRKVRFSSSIELGDNSGIGDNSFFQGKVRIGNDVMIGPEVMFIASKHVISSDGIPMNKQGELDSEIQIGNNVWIGARAIILAGVKIEDGSVIGAGAVVSKNVDSNTIVGGVPARLIRKR